MLPQSKNLPISIPEVAETVRVVDSARHLERGMMVSQVRFLPAQSGSESARLVSDTYQMALPRE